MSANVSLLVNTIFTYYYKPRGVTILPIHPDDVATDMEPEGGIPCIEAISTEESTKGMINVMDKASIESSGKFLDYTGASLPW
jgi:hypothetical protein